MSIQTHDLFKIYREADVETVALRGIDLEVARGEFVALMGRSGSGKTTLLQLLAAADRPTAGRVVVDGVDLSRADEPERAGVRGARVGIVFQSQNMVPFLSLEEGVLLFASLAGRPVDRGVALAALEQVGLADRGRHRPDQLSGGEQQRAALAAVLVTSPSILLADEITGELDSLNAARLLELIAALHRGGEMTTVLATHDPEVAAHADRVIELRDGRVVGDRRLA